MKMKRIAYNLLYLIALFFVGCSDKTVVIEGKTPTPEPKTELDGSISLRIIVPKNNVTTYAGEDATNLENRIDTLFVDLYQGSATPLEELKFYDNALKSKIWASTNDSIITVDTIVSNLVANGGAVTAKVFANRKIVDVITTDIPFPDQTATDAKTLFFMSGVGDVNYADGKYSGTVNLLRNVAKLRINISKHSIVFPSDLSINYNDVKIKVLDAANHTSQFFVPGTYNNLNSSDYIDYVERTGSALRNSLTHFTSTNGGQIDSLYLYENYQTVPPGIATKVQITIPTYSLSEGPKTATHTYPLICDGKIDIIRNTIYTLDIKVQGQNLEPVVTLSVQPWNDITVSGDILGTYLTMEASELSFNSLGEAYLDFCTDAQAVYMNFDDFNNANSSRIGFNEDIIPIGIEAADHNIAPPNFQDGQILLDKQHCSSFGFKLNLAKFPTFPNVTFGGTVCIRAGNIIKCFAFTGRRTYDAHFIVGEELLESGNTFTSADVTTDDGGNWLEISTKKLYDNYASTTFSGSSSPLYLHLDENLTGQTRTGSITVMNGGMEKKIYIAQLSAIPVGRFGYSTINPTGDLNIYDTQLFTEHIYEYRSDFKSLVPYRVAKDTEIPFNNYIYNGLGATISTNVFNPTPYNDSTFNYLETKFQAMHYCAYKNRPSKGSNGSLNESDVKWHLPSQAQLTAMWISYESYKSLSTSNYHVGKDTASYWSATANDAYREESQYMNFLYGNIGHYYKNISESYWSRCVRSGTSVNDNMVESNSGAYPTVDFSKGMPSESYTIASKNGQRDSEQSSTNATLFRRLRIALEDVSAETDSLNDAYTKCTTVYSEPGAPSGSWRLPTQRELQAIWILQEEIRTLFPTTFKYFVEDNYYWSSSYASETLNSSGYASAWCIFGNRETPGEASNMPHLPKSTLLKARCVREQYP